MVSSVLSIEGETTPPAHNEGTPLLPSRLKMSQSGEENTHGSSITGAVFNLTNSIVGAGIIGLGGAIASSGGLISIACIIFFAILANISYNMVVTLAAKGAGGSYEQLGEVTYGKVGFWLITVSKFVYSFGCMVAYVVIVKDNFASAVEHLVFGTPTEDSRFLPETEDDGGTLASFLSRPDPVTFLLSATLILPLCLLRDMTPLEKFSVIKIVAVVFIVLIVAYLFFANPDGNVRLEGGATFQNWFEIRQGFRESVGTLVFTFVAQHTVHLTYNSLRDDVRNIESWRVVSSTSILIATVLSLGAGVFVYVTFWEQTSSAMFSLYPPLASIDVAKLLLCLSMIFIYPLPLFSCRELIVISTTVPTKATEAEGRDADDDSGLDVRNGRTTNQTAWWLLPRDRRQLILPLHFLVTVVLWFVATMLAIKAPSLGDVLNLVGCLAGTMIAYVLPSLFYFKMTGYSHLAMLVLVVGTTVGLVGTYYSMKQLVGDSK